MRTTVIALAVLLCLSAVSIAGEPTREELLTKIELLEAKLALMQAEREKPEPTPGTVKLSSLKVGDTLRFLPPYDGKVYVYDGPYSPIAGVNFFTVVEKGTNDATDVDDQDVTPVSATNPMGVDSLTAAERGDDIPDYLQHSYGRAEPAKVATEAQRAEWNRQFAAARAAIVERNKHGHYEYEGPCGDPVWVQDWAPLPNSAADCDVN